MAISSLSFWFGGTQIASGKMDFKQMLTAFFAIFYASFGVAQVLLWGCLLVCLYGNDPACCVRCAAAVCAARVCAPTGCQSPCAPRHPFPSQAQAAFPDLAKAAGACQRVFRILDQQPSAGAPAAGGGGKAATQQPQPGAEVAIQGRVEFRRVAFAYPSRPQRLVLKEFSLAVEAGTSCALVRCYVALAVPLRAGGLRRAVGACWVADFTTCTAPHLLAPTPAPIALPCLARAGGGERHRQVHCAGPAGALLRAAGWDGEKRARGRSG